MAGNFRVSDRLESFSIDPVLPQPDRPGPIRLGDTAMIARTVIRAVIARLTQAIRVAPALSTLCFIFIYILPGTWRCAALPPDDQRAVGSSACPHRGRDLPDPARAGVEDAGPADLVADGHTGHRHRGGHVAVCGRFALRAGPGISSGQLSAGRSLSCIAACRDTASFRKRRQPGKIQSLSDRPVCGFAISTSTGCMPSTAG